MDQLGLKEALLCGHSLGGALALRVALEHPARVAGVVVINSNSAAGTARWREDVQPRLEAMAQRIRAEGKDFLRESRLYPASSTAIPVEARDRLTRDYEALPAIGLANTCEALMGRVNAFERLGEVDVPTLVVVGSKDPDFATSAPGWSRACAATWCRCSRSKAATPPTSKSPRPSTPPSSASPRRSSTCGNHRGRGARCS